MTWLPSLCPPSITTCSSRSARAPPPWTRSRPHGASHVLRAPGPSGCQADILVLSAYVRQVVRLHAAIPSPAALVLYCSSLCPGARPLHGRIPIAAMGCRCFWGSRPCCPSRSLRRAPRPQAGEPGCRRRCPEVKIADFGGGSTPASPTRPDLRDAVRRDAAHEPQLAGEVDFHGLAGRR